MQLSLQLEQWYVDELECIWFPGCTGPSGGLSIRNDIRGPQCLQCWKEPQPGLRNGLFAGKPARLDECNLGAEVEAP